MYTLDHYYKPWRNLLALVGHLQRIVTLLKLNSLGSWDSILVECSWRYKMTPKDWNTSSLLQTNCVIDKFESKTCPTSAIFPKIKSYVNVLNCKHDDSMKVSQFLFWLMNILIGRDLGEVKEESLSSPLQVMYTGVRSCTLVQRLKVLMMSVDSWLREHFRSRTGSCRGSSSCPWPRRWSTWWRWRQRR